mmetsp:Transcript_11704/g.25733  ORF Transcript_11704/g.25733 Transcript_11704/m.25733 type:complete len:82 (+) Transcript_11704:124-369(+)
MEWHSRKLHITGKDFFLTLGCHHRKVEPRVVLRGRGDGDPRFSVVRCVCRRLAEVLLPPVIAPTAFEARLNKPPELLAAFA